MVQDAITRDLIDASPDVLDKLSKGINTENQYILDLSAHASQLSILEQKLQDIYLNLNIETATGTGLDFIGEKVGVNRIQPQPSLVEVLVSLPTAADTDLVIPAGTLCRIVEIQENGSEYVTSEEVVLNAGVTSATITCESVLLDYLPPLVEGAVIGLVGFNDLTVTNEAPSTSGRRIESDDDYRKRIKTWKEQSIIGTRSCIMDYLENYNGLDGYSLIPRYAGIGTLKIVCDTIETNLQKISEGVHENCMIITDNPPLCVLPTGRQLEALTITVSRSSGVSTLSDEELEQLVVAQTKTYVEGGITRYGFLTNGLGIGGSLYPSRLLGYLVDNVPECANIRLSVQEEVSVNPDEKIHLSSVSVVLE